MDPPNQESKCLKPHGSINWNGFLRENLRPDYAYWSEIFAGSKLSYDKSQPLSNPDKGSVNPDLTYMLFPGDPELPQQDRDLQMIWDKAREAISRSETIIFLGYSLPTYDTFAIDFFRECVCSKRVEVYNPSNQVLEKYRSIFGKDVLLEPKRFEESPYARPLRD
jgi:hypothetical protein